MRRTLLSLLALASASPAFAQDQSSAVNGIGPYQFGASVAAIRATSPGAAWRVDDLPNVGQVLSGGPRLRVGATPFSASFVFNRDALTNIALGGESPETCTDAARHLLEASLEPSFGAFGSAPGAIEPGPIASVSRTSAGSEIRERVDVAGVHILFASMRGSAFILLKAAPHSDQAAGCQLTLLLSPSAPYAGPLLAPLSYEELDRAQSLVSPNWISRPTVSTFDRFYPVRARRANVTARAMLDCVVETAGSLRCLVAQESPQGEGFGEAALQIAQDFRVLEDEAGASVVGKRIHLPISFRLSP